MITDQKQTGIPSAAGIRSRTQLVKPNQVNNIGRSMPQSQNLAGAAPVPQRQTMQAVPNTSQTPIVQPQPQQTSAPSYNPIVQAPSTTTGGELNSTANSPATAVPAGTELLDDAVPYSQMQADSKEAVRKAIRGMSSVDIVELLDELANGSLHGID